MKKKQLPIPETPDIFLKSKPELNSDASAINELKGAILFGIKLVFGITIFSIIAFSLIYMVEDTSRKKCNGDEVFINGTTECWPRAEAMKPLILLYPEREQVVNVELEYTPGFSATFPEYDNSKKGWSVTANPDGTLLDHTTKQETYGLFWEGNGANTPYDLSKGWVVAGKDLRNFLYEKLSEIGLNTKEKSDFIMFWYPKLQEYPYIQITFAGDEYIESAPLKITPKPDSLLRVFMVAKPLGAMKEIEPQKLEKFERKGFSVVEWGGTIMKK